MATVRKIPFQWLATHITGVNSPVFGVNWNPPEDRQRIVRNLVTYLEDRRVLYNPYDMEYGLWVTDSILDIRKELTGVLKDCPDEEALTRPIKTMRTACRNYLDLIDSPASHGHCFDHQNLCVALGQLRGVFGLQLAELCVAYGVDIEGELVGIVPFEDEGEEPSR